jgi:hypothetical protein
MSGLDSDGPLHRQREWRWPGKFPEINRLEVFADAAR